VALNVQVCHANLQDALIQAADRPWFGAPDLLEGFVLFPVQASVELRHSLARASGEWLISGVHGRDCT
jgi:hypothetical protein